jgi:hypothetical protein
MKTNIFSSKNLYYALLDFTRLFGMVLIKIVLTMTLMEYTEQRQ